MHGRHKLGCLDGLRGIAILAVIAFHHRLLHQFDPAHSVLYRAFAPARFGHAGVNLFLVLSGFCLTHSLIRRDSAGRAPTLFEYLSDRFRRIAPPYYAAIAIYVGAALLAPSIQGYTPIPSGLPSMRQIAYHATFLHGLREDTKEGLSAPLWSLSLEFQFYATLPLLYVLARRIGYGRTLALVILVSAAWRMWIYCCVASEIHLIHTFFLGRWSEFAVGMLVAAWFNSPERVPAGSRVVPALFATATALLVAAVGMSIAGHPLQLVMDLTFGVGFGALLAAALLSAEAGGSLGKAISFRPLVWIGTISYSVYLMHQLVLATLTWAYRRAVASPNSMTEAIEMVAAYGLVVGVGLFFYWAVERQFVRSVDARATSQKAAAEPAHPLLLQATTA